MEKLRMGLDIIKNKAYAIESNYVFVGTTTN